MSGLQVKTMAELMDEGKEADILFWVGSAGSFDDRAKKITRAFVQILNNPTSQGVGVYFSQYYAKAVNLAFEIHIRKIDLNVLDEGSYLQQLLSHLLAFLDQL